MLSWNAWREEVCLLLMSTWCSRTKTFICNIDCGIIFDRDDVCFFFSSLNDSKCCILISFERVARHSDMHLCYSNVVRDLGLVYEFFLGAVVISRAAI